MIETAAGAFIGVLLAELLLLARRRWRLRRATRRWEALVREHNLEGKTGAFRIPGRDA